MGGLENALGNSKVVYITPQGLNDSGFDYDGFQVGLHNLFSRDAIHFGVIFSDGRRHSEAYGVFRYFERRAQLTHPVVLPSMLEDNDIEITPLMVDALGNFFQKLTRKESDYGDHVVTYEGTFKKVQITYRKLLGHEWEHKFLDFYLENKGLAGVLGELGRTTSEVFQDVEKWKRYGLTERFLAIFEDEVNNLYFPKSSLQPTFMEDNKERWTKLIGEKAKEMLEHFLRWRANAVKPFFRNEEDYRYFLLAFYKKEIPFDDIHKEISRLREEESKESLQISSFNAELDRLKSNYWVQGIQDVREAEMKARIFEMWLTSSDLERSYLHVIRHGKRMDSPVKISPALYNLGFFVFPRRRKIQPSSYSCALIKIRGKPRELQLGLFSPRSQNEITIPLAHHPLPKLPHLQDNTILF